MKLLHNKTASRVLGLMIFEFMSKLKSNDLIKLVTNTSCEILSNHLPNGNVKSNLELSSHALRFNCLNLINNIQCQIPMAFKCYSNFKNPIPDCDPYRLYVFVSVLSKSIIYPMFHNNLF